MRDEFRRLRSAIRSMPTREATAMIQAFRLPDEEEAAVLLMDVRRMSRVQIGTVMGLSPDAVRNRRASAYARMCAEMNTVNKAGSG